MMKNVLFFFCFTCWLPSSRAQSYCNDIIERYRKFQFTVNQIQIDSISHWNKSLTTSGKWNDIDYDSKVPSGWDPSRHLARINGMAIAWANPQSQLYQDKQTWIALNRAIDHWLVQRYQSSNWWHNQIGVPQFWRNIIILVRKNLSVEQRKSAMEVLGQYRLKGTGANLIWSADLALHSAALSGNKELVKQASNVIANEIKISTGDGIRPDFSFHQHGARLQTHHYGASFLKDNIRLAWQLKETPWEIPAVKINILTSFVIEGWQWMARGIYSAPGTLDRALSRSGFMQNADLRIYLPYLIELAPQSKMQLKKLYEGQLTNKQYLEGYRTFPYSDFAAYQQKDFSAFLKTVSTRTLSTEKINLENLQGTFLNFGDSYLMKNGQEYFNLMPVWDWSKLPGVTNFSGAKTIERLPFSGGVSNNNYGFSSMDINSTDSGAISFKAFKSWFFYKNVMVSLISEISLNSGNHELFTTLDQSRLQTEVITDRPGNVLKKGNHILQNPKWIYHSGFAYIPLGKSLVKLKVDTVTGKWSDINVSGNNNTVCESIFKPVLYHDNNSSSAYVVASVKSSVEAEAIFKNPVWKILCNTSLCQAVAFNTNITMITFRKGGDLTFAGTRLSVDNPCLVLIDKDQLYIADPLHAGSRIKILFNSRNYIVTLPNDGSTIKVD